jgi:hypothetical protein
MEFYSPFFQTLHDERSPPGHLGNGTHASILRGIVFKDANLKELDQGVETDFAIIWDADHDTRIIKAVEAIYRAGFLSSILMIGERKGTLHAIVLGQTYNEDFREQMLHSHLEKQLHEIAQSIEGDPWLSSFRVLTNPDRTIIDDDDEKVRLYLANLKMLWRLGVRVGIDHYLRIRTTNRLDPPGVVAMNKEVAAILKSFSNIPDRLDAAEFEALWKTAQQTNSERYAKYFEAKASKSDAPKAVSKVRLVES